MLLAGDLTEQVIGLAIEVHRHTGPGCLSRFMSSAYALNCAQQTSHLNDRSPFRSSTRRSQLAKGSGQTSSWRTRSFWKSNQSLRSCRSTKRSSIPTYA